MVLRIRLFLALATAVCAAPTVGCGGGQLGDRMGAGGAAGVHIAGTGGAAGAGDAAGSSATPPDPCLGAADPRLVIAPQRMLLLTSRETINMIRALVGEEEATAILRSGMFAV